MMFVQHKPKGIFELITWCGRPYYGAVFHYNDQSIIPECKECSEALEKHCEALVDRAMESAKLD